MVSRLPKFRIAHGKTMTDNDTFLAYLRQVFQIEELDEAV